MLRIAITRAQPEADNTAARLRARGAEPVLAPLLHIEPRAFDASTQGVQALLFTSSNGVRSFAAASAVRALLVLAVGDATAQAALDVGFAAVRSAEGDVAALAALARSALTPNAGALLHIGGAAVAGDLVQALRAAGFTAERRIAYDARAAAALPAAFSTPLDIVLFHSARAARTYIALGAPNAARLAAACLSPAVADALRGAGFRHISVAPIPREDALLDAALTGKGAPSGASA